METQIDPQKVLAALEAEKAKRNAAKAESGEVIVIPRPDDPIIVLGDESDGEIERMKAAWIARVRAENPGKAVFWDETRITFIRTGVPRADDPPEHTSPDGTACEGDKWGDAQRLYADEPTDMISQGRPCDSEAGVFENQPLPETPAPTRVWITVRPATEDGFPGRIEEAYFVVLDGTLVLSDAAGFQIASEQLRPDDNPAAIARSLLSRATAGSDFNRPLPYRPLSIA